MRPPGKRTASASKAAALILALTAASAWEGGRTAIALEANDPGATITSLPEILDPNCRYGQAKLYDECGDQLALFNAALARAAGEGKVLLVSYGAEWCIWCHVFDQYIHGGQTRFTYTFGAPGSDARESATLYEREEADVSADANALRSYVAANFVVVHIESQFSPNGNAILKLTGADRYADGGLPYIFTVKADGQFAGAFEHNRVETRRDGFFDWYRGYNREGLIKHLSELHALALAPGG